MSHGRRDTGAEDPTELCGMVGRSAVMRQLFARVERLASLSTPVLIQGEPGSGKQLVGRALHELSSRRHFPLVVVDCSLRRDLFEPQVFGHVGGAVSGVGAAGNPGLLAAAEGGT